MKNSDFLFSPGDVVKNSNKNQFIILTQFKTTKKGSIRYVVEPVCLPGQLLIKGEKGMSLAPICFQRLFSLDLIRRINQINRINRIKKREMSSLSERVYVGKKALKVGGSYQAKGKIIQSFFSDTDNNLHHVFEFENPPGLLHIFRHSQLEIIYSEKTESPASLFHMEDRVTWSDCCGYGYR